MEICIFWKFVTWKTALLWTTALLEDCVTLKDCVIENRDTWETALLWGTALLVTVTWNFCDCEKLFFLKNCVTLKNCDTLKNWLFLNNYVTWKIALGCVTLEISLL